MNGKTKVWMLYGIKKGSDWTPVLIGCYKETKKAWEQYNEIDPTPWKWVDIKEVEVL